jgi:hypothetical protein
VHGDVVVLDHEISSCGQEDGSKKGNIQTAGLLITLGTQKFYGP